MIPVFTACSAGCPPAGNYMFARTGTAKKLWWLGDSLTLGTTYNNLNHGGMRVLQYNRITLNGYQIENVGTLTDGTWPNPKHDGHSGYTVQNLFIVINAEYGTANIPLADITIAMMGTNNCVVGMYDGPTDIAQYITNIQLIQSRNTGMANQGVIVVTTIGDKSDVTEHGYVVDLNSRFPGAWDYIDANRPVGAPTLKRADIYGALGGRFDGPSYDVTTGNTHWKDTGFSKGEAEIWSTIEGAGLVQPCCG